MEALADAIEKKDRYTGGHTKRVAHYSVRIASRMPGITQTFMEQLRLAAILHDVGKIGIEDCILKKPSALNPDEARIMRSHPDLGHDLLEQAEGMQDVIDGVRCHHERWDGQGYPLGLAGDRIPLIARIIAVADTYDAMVSTRPYRKGLDSRVAYEEILRQSGTQFDPRVVSAFGEAFTPKRAMRTETMAGSVIGADCD